MGWCWERGLCRKKDEAEVEVVDGRRKRARLRIMQLVRRTLEDRLKRAG